MREQITDLYERLKERTDEGQIDEYTKASIINLSKKVMNALTRNYRDVRKEVSSIMGGRVLEYDAKTIRNKALADGEKRGEKRGADLMNFLWSNGRGEDALKASSDENYLEQLLEEFQSGKLTMG